MILVDANLLLYAVNRDLPAHATARRWWEATISSGESVGLPWTVLLAFVRVATSARVFDAPLAPERALGYIDEWVEQPGVRTIAPRHGHWDVLRNLLVQTGTAGNLTSDAHLAALGLTYGATIYSADNDFKRFPGVSHVNPLIRP